MSFSIRHRWRLRKCHLIPGNYLVDGQRLFRVIGRLVCGRSVLVLIEDCLTLEVAAYAVSEIVTMGLRPLRASVPPALPAPSLKPPGELTASR